jgi:hypothetical protein
VAREDFRLRESDFAGSGHLLSVVQFLNKLAINVPQHAFATSMRACLTSPHHHSNPGDSMQTMARKLCCAALAVAALLLGGCGGSSSDTSGGTTPGGTTPGGTTPGASTDTTTLSGVVFSESACPNVPVTVTAADGTVLSSNVVTGSDGSYSASIANPASNPVLFVSASCPNGNGGEDPLVSIVTPGNVTGVTVTQTVNLNGLANFMSALVTKSGDPTKLIGEVKSGVLKIDAAVQTVARDKLNAMLQQVIFAVGFSAVDPVTMPSTGNVAVKTLLQTVNIKFLPQPDGKQTVQIRLKLANVSDDAGQPVFELSNVDLVDGQKLQALIAGVSSFQVPPSALIPAGTEELMADLVARMNTLLSLPGETRWSSQASPLLNALLYEAFLNNGSPILELFNPEFEASNETVLIFGEQSGKVTAPTLQYLRPDGLLAFTVRQNFNPQLPETLLLYAKVRADGKLGLSGNQSPFRAGLVARSERRTFLYQTDISYLSTGFSFKVPLQSKDGVPVTKVIVTPPPAILKNASFTLLPGPDGMALATRVVVSGQTVTAGPNSFVRLRTEYVNGDIPKLHPSLFDYTQFFIDTDLSTSAIAAIVPYAQMWKFEFYVGGSDKPELPVYYPTPARPLTIAELRNTTLPDLSAATKSALQSIQTIDEGSSYTALTSRPALTLTPTGNAQVFMSVQGQGRLGPDAAAPPIFFRDEPLKATIYKDLRLPTAVNPNVATTVPCTNGSYGDAHCASESTYGPDPSLLLTGVDLVVAPPGSLEKAQFMTVLKFAAVYPPNQ